VEGCPKWPAKRQPFHANGNGQGGKKNRMKRWKKRAKLKYVAQSNEEK